MYCARRAAAQILSWGSFFFFLLLDEFPAATLASVSLCRLVSLSLSLSRVFTGVPPLYVSHSAPEDRYYTSLIRITVCARRAMMCSHTHTQCVCVCVDRGEGGGGATAHKNRPRPDHNIHPPPPPLAFLRRLCPSPHPDNTDIP